MSYFRDHMSCTRGDLSDGPNLVSLALTIAEKFGIKIIDSECLSQTFRL